MPYSKDNVYPESQWIDEGRLEFNEMMVTSNDISSEENGCDISPNKK